MPRTAQIHPPAKIKKAPTPSPSHSKASSCSHIQWMSMFRHQIQAEFHLPFILTGSSVPTLLYLILLYLSLSYSYSQRFRILFMALKLHCKLSTVTTIGCKLKQIHSRHKPFCDPKIPPLSIHLNNRLFPNHLHDIWPILTAVSQLEGPPSASLKRLLICHRTMFVAKMGAVQHNVCHHTANHAPC